MLGTAAALGPGRGDADEKSGQPIRPGRAQAWQPILDLHFADDSGLVEWWLPELVLLGNTDRTLRAQGTVSWKKTTGRWSYEHVNPDGRLLLAAEVEQVDNGWLAALTVGNRTNETWPDVVCPVCLLLRASGSFEDEDWTRTYYRSAGEFLTYHGRERGGGRSIYQMSLVAGRKQIERTERHKNKWGFTKQLSDHGIIAVRSANRSTVITTAWEPTHHLQANLKRTFSCIHANPYFGPIAPGESRTARGCVLLTAGTLERAWEETRAAVKHRG